MAFLLDRLGHPERRPAVIHVGGTNGKGSVAAALACAYQAAGHRTALFTSPHLERWTERFALDGAEMSPDEFADLVESLWPLVAEAEAAGLDPPTEFEFLTAMAYVWAEAREADVLVQEVGLGGRLDSTNVVESPVVAVLTNVSLDHTDRLGPTVAAIAREKVGIVKPGRPVVSGFAGEAAAILRAKADEVGAPLWELDRSVAFACHEEWRGGPLAETLLDYRGLRWQADGLPLALSGPHEARNMALVLLALEVANDAGGPPVPWPAAREALGRVAWPGRLEAVPLAAGPTAILDGAHNPAAAEALALALPRVARWRRLHAVLGMLADKDVETALPLLARHADRVFLTEPPSARAAPLARLEAALTDRQRSRAELHPSPEAAFRSAQAGLGEGDVILVAGSLYLVGALRPLVRRAARPTPPPRPVG